MGIEYRLFCEECGVYADTSFRRIDEHLGIYNMKDILEFLDYHALHKGHAINIWDSTDLIHEGYGLCDEYRNWEYKKWE